jgi:MFS family permease
MIGVSASSFPTTLLSASLEVIRTDLHTNTSTVAWVQIAPSIAFAVTMPLFGKIGDLYGHRRTFIGGFLALGVSALLTAAAWNIGSLIAIRTIGQMSGAATSTAAFGLIAGAFKAAQRAKAIALYTSVLALSPVVAVVAGGPLVDSMGWRVLFLAQAVPAFVAVVAAIPVLAETPRTLGLRFDVGGAVLLAAGITSLMFAVNRGNIVGWSSAVILVCLIAGPLCLAAFVVVERTVRAPLIPLALFRHRNVSASVITNLLVQLTYIGGFTTAPFLAHRIFGYSTYKTALLMAIRPVLFSIAAWYAGRKHALWGARLIQMTASGVMAIGTLLTAFAAWEHSVVLLVVALAVTGWGVGFGRPSSIALLTNTVRDEQIGIATGVFNTFGTVGSAIGPAVLLAMIGDSTDAGPFAGASIVGAVIAVASIGTAAFLVDPGQRVRRRRSDRLLPSVVPATGTATDAR